MYRFKMSRKASKEGNQAITGGVASGISPAAEFISRNVDLLTEILVRLPAKSLIRFKCVSKQWLSLISHSQFGSNHSRRNPRPSISGLYLYFYTGFHSVSLRRGQNLPSLSFLDGLGEHSTTTILDSCNGLVLCYSRHLVGGISRQQHIVCNLTTKNYTILPSSNLFKPCSVYAYLAFDPSKSIHYKVLLFDDRSLPSGQVVHVYCSRTASWKDVTIQQEHFGEDHCVFWNGAIHWFSLQDSLVRFDVDALEAIVMPKPQTPIILTRDKIMYFGESGGCLILIQSTFYCHLEFIIVELDKDYCGWIVKCQVNLRPLITVFPEMEDGGIRVLKVLPVANGDNEFFFALVLVIPGRILSYDVKCKTWDVLRDLSVDELCACHLNYVNSSIETLSPV